MTVADLLRLAFAGADWSRQCARALGVTSRMIHYIAAGTRSLTVRQRNVLAAILSHKLTHLDRDRDSAIDKVRLDWEARRAELSIALAEIERDLEKRRQDRRRKGEE